MSAMFMQGIKSGVLQIVNVKTLKDTDSFIVFANENDLMSKLCDRFSAQHIIVEGYAKASRKSSVMFAKPSTFRSEETGETGETGLKLTVESSLDDIDFTTPKIDLREHQKAGV